MAACQRVFIFISAVCQRLLFKMAACQRVFILSMAACQRLIN
jgi:hypothetical protein